MNLEQTAVNLSVIIICEKEQWEFLFDIIATVEDCLDIVDEVLIVTSRFISRDEEEVLTYFSFQGYIICQFDDNFSLANVLNLSIQKSQGKYIFPILAKNKINSNYISDSVDILENKPNIGVIYGDIELFGENNQIQVLPDFSGVQLLRQNFINLSSIFRKKVWEDCGGFDVNFPSQTESEWKFWLSAVENNWDFFHFPQVLLYQRIILDQGVPKIQNKQEIQKHPLVSVCIPTFNGDRFIAEAISSILSQTYPTLEIIVADDGSTDQTAAIVKTFQDKTSIDILLFSHQHLGLAQNCNFALSQAQGKYIKFLFQDDLLSPDCITQMVQLAEQDPEIGLVFSPREICFLDEVAETDSDLISIYQDFQNIHQAWSSLKPIQQGEELLTDPHLFKHPINKIGEPSTVLIRREVFEKIGGFDPQLNQLVDLDLWLRIMGNYKVGFVNKILSYFRLHTQQKTYQNISENISTDLKFYQKVYSHPAYHFLPSSVRDRALCIYTINLNHFYLYFSDYSSGTFLEDLRQLRREVAEYWLKQQLLPEEFQTKPSSYFKIVYRILLRNKSLRAEPLTESEQMFVQGLIHTIENSSANVQITEKILALMLYQNSTQFSFPSDLVSVNGSYNKDIIDLINFKKFNLKSANNFRSKPM
jgi:glycosyltransferase involved in cell wall biosynthesis